MSGKVEAGEVRDAFGPQGRCAKSRVACVNTAFISPRSTDWVRRLVLGGPMYISSVNVHDFRCFRRAVTSFVHAGAPLETLNGALPNVTLMVGINGSGKTTILRAVALGVLAPILKESGYRPYYLVRIPKTGLHQVRIGRVCVDGVLDDHETAAIAPREAARAGPDRLANIVEVTRRNDYDVLEVKTLAGNRDESDHAALSLAENPRRRLPLCVQFSNRTCV